MYIKIYYVLKSPFFPLPFFVVVIVDDDDDVVTGSVIISIISTSSSSKSIVSVASYVVASITSAYRSS